MPDLRNKCLEWIVNNYIEKVAKTLDREFFETRMERLKFKFRIKIFKT